MKSLSRFIRRTHFLSLGRRTRGYFSIAKGKVGLVQRRGKTLLHAGANKGGPFVRAQYNHSKRASGYVFAKLHNAGAGVVGRINRHVSGRLAFDNKGPFAEGRFHALKLKRYLK